MKGRTLVIGIVIFVILIVGLISFLMMSTINQIKEEKNEEISMAAIQVVENMHQLYDVPVK